MVGKAIDTEKLKRSYTTAVNASNDARAQSILNAAREAAIKTDHARMPGRPATGRLEEIDLSIQDLEDAVVTGASPNAIRRAQEGVMAALKPNGVNPLDGAFVTRYLQEKSQAATSKGRQA